MTAEEYLQSIRDMTYKIAVLEQKRDKIAIDMIPSRAITYDDLRVQTSPKGDALENTAISIAAEVERIDTQIRKTRDTLFKRSGDALEKIMLLKEGQCRRFLVDYYIQCESITHITREYGFANKRTTHNLKTRAVKYFETVDKKS